ncbi:MAG: hypothetical protein RLZZ449_1028 [Actinomycetota bacterium]
MRADLGKLSALVAERIGSELAEEHVRLRRLGEAPWTTDEELLFAQTVAMNESIRLSNSLVVDGKLALSPPEQETLTSMAIAHVLGLGRLQVLMDDEEISDIHVKGSSPVWVKLRNGVREERAPVADTDDELIDLIRRAATRLGRAERRFDGSRLFAAMEVSMRPTLVIRKHQFSISRLSDLELRGLCDPLTTSFLAAAVRAKRNLIICGGTGSGKTTLLRSLINEVGRFERIVTIEDAYELGIDRFEDLHPDHDALQARPANIEGNGEITLVDLTRMALRMDPDRVIVGEVRGAEAFPMLLAMSQGNNGSMCTMHADSARSVFPKLAAYVSMASTGLPVETINTLIASAVHFVVHIELIAGVRQIKSILEVVDADGSTIISNEVFSRSREGRSRSFSSLRQTSRALLLEHGFDAPGATP